MSWISPRIWRSAESKFNEDEPLNCVEVYTPETLKDIADQGFDAIWMRGRLWELIHSEIYPELNESNAKKRIESLKKVIGDGKKLGVNVYLYFCEPQALPREHDFWKKHPELAGEPFVEPELNWDVLSFCTSTPQFKEFFNESVSNLYDDLAGLGGVILITASEYQSHCWSHRARRSIGDKYLDKCLVDLECPNCKDREPADVVGELVGIWKANADRRKQPPQVWAWNWSWSIWYEPPQREVIDKLPEGIKLMCDFERGGFRDQAVGKVAIDEYSLGYIGPSEQFTGAFKAASERNMPTCAKLQIGTTHELATVPNLPLIPNLFDKLQRIDELGIAGVMGSWNFGNSPSLNTAAFKLFVNQPALRKNRDGFCETLASEYLNASDPQKVVAAWQKFCQAFAEYPLSIKMLYHSPMNYAVAYPLTLEYRDYPMGPSWIPHSPWGDRLEDCIEPFTVEQVCTCLEKMETYWQEGLELYNQAGKDELDCAKMISCHISAMKNIFEFHNWRRKKMVEMNITGPCTLSPDETASKILANHMQIMKNAKKLAESNDAFGYHQEPGKYFYTSETITTAIAETQKNLD